MEGWDEQLILLEACELVCYNAKFIYKYQFSTSCKLSESDPYKTPPSAQRAKLESQHSWRRWPSRWWAARGLANCRLRLLAIFLSFQSDFIEILRSACYFCRLGKVTGGYRPPLYNYVQMSSSQVEWASKLWQCLKISELVTLAAKQPWLGLSPSLPFNWEHRFISPAKTST